MPSRAVWEISADAIVSNTKEISRFAGKKVIAVVKANAYGHGATLLAKLLQGLAEVSHFAVATPEEGATLREAAIKKPILILGGFFEEELGLIEEYRLTPVVSDRRQLLSVIRRRIPYHLNLDTGMGRLGFTKVPYALLKLFPPEGVMTHFPTAEDREFTERQIRKFKRLIKPLKVKFVHLQNSAGLVYKVPFANLVRVGLSLYGEYGSGGLREAGLRLTFPSRIRARILEVRRLAAGSCISYGCRYKLKKPSWVGVISFGYADGLRRSLFKTLKVFYKGKTYPVAGNITMDLTAVDFGNTKPAVGGWVEIVNDKRKFSDIAKLLGTIPYEVMTSIGERVERRLV